MHGNQPQLCFLLNHSIAVKWTVLKYMISNNFGLFYTFKSLTYLDLFLNKTCKNVINTLMC